MLTWLSSGCEVMICFYFTTATGPVHNLPQYFAEKRGRMAIHATRQPFQSCHPERSEGPASCGGRMLPFPHLVYRPRPRQVMMSSNERLAPWRTVNISQNSRKVWTPGMYGERRSNGLSRTSAARLTSFEIGSALTPTPGKTRQGRFASSISPISATGKATTRTRTHSTG